MIEGQDAHFACQEELGYALQLAAVVGVDSEAHAARVEDEHAAGVGWVGGYRVVVDVGLVEGHGEGLGVGVGVIVR
jgi:hypothetical protein